MFESGDRIGRFGGSFPRQKGIRMSISSIIAAAGRMDL
jgi:hypothetical protein